MSFRKEDKSPLSKDTFNLLLINGKWTQIVELIKNHKVTTEHLNQVTEFPHRMGVDYIFTVTAPNLWHIIFEGREGILHYLLKQNLITKEHLEIKPTHQSDTFYYNYPTLVEVMLHNRNYWGIQRLQECNIISPECLMQKLDPDQQTAYLLILVESEDITNFMACSDAGMLQTADGLLDEQQKINDYDDTCKNNYVTLINAEFDLVRKHTPDDLSEYPGFFQNKIKHDIAIREEKLKNSEIQQLTHEALHPYNQYIQSLTKQLTQYLQKQDFLLIDDEQFRASVISAFKKVAEEKIILPSNELEKLLDDLVNKKGFQIKIA